eukprot:1190489-Prorocentrum_minimum.AAC.3
MLISTHVKLRVCHKKPAPGLRDAHTSTFTSTTVLLQTNSTNNCNCQCGYYFTLLITRITVVCRIKSIFELLGWLERPTKPWLAINRLSRACEHARRRKQSAPAASRDSGTAVPAPAALSGRRSGATCDRCR